MDSGKYDWRKAQLTLLFGGWDLTVILLEKTKKATSRLYIDVRFSGIRVLPGRLMIARICSIFRRARRGGMAIVADGRTKHKINRQNLRCAHVSRLSWGNHGEEGVIFLNWRMD